MGYWVDSFKWFLDICVDSSKQFLHTCVELTQHVYCSESIDLGEFPLV